MAISSTLSYASLDELYLDPKNPRLGRNFTSEIKSQPEILDAMSDWTLDELATSFIVGGGFWTNEALLVCKENLYGKKDVLIVIEGNRRLAALKLLKKAYDGKAISKKWKDIAKSSTHPKDLFKKIPYLLVDNRKDVESIFRISTCYWNKRMAAS